MSERRAGRLRWRMLRGREMLSGGHRAGQSGPFGTPWGAGACGVSVRRLATSDGLQPEEMGHRARYDSALTHRPPPPPFSLSLSRLSASHDRLLLPSLLFFCCFFHGRAT
eukprot:3177035-Rhodomonas_salina.1